MDNCTCLASIVLFEYVVVMFRQSQIINKITEHKRFIIVMIILTSCRLVHINQLVHINIASTHTRGITVWY